MTPRLFDSLRLKWRIVIAYWTLLFVAGYFATAGWWAMSGSVDGPAGDSLGLAGLADIKDVMVYAPFNVFMAVCMGAFILLQLMLVLPMRYPARTERGAPVWLAIGAAALLAAGLVVGFLAAVVGVLSAYDVITTFPIQTWWGLAVVVAVHWALMVPLMAAFVKREDNEGATRKLSMFIFVGSIVDVAAMIPLDVMIRRKTNCYSWSTSVFSLGAATAIGLLALGPAVWIPISCRRRRRWFETRCAACGYDMTGGGGRCPECGTTFRALEANQPQIGQHANAQRDEPQGTEPQGIEPQGTEP